MDSHFFWAWSMEPRKSSEKLLFLHWFSQIRLVYRSNETIIKYFGVSLDRELTWTSHISTKLQQKDIKDWNSFTLYKIVKRPSVQNSHYCCINKFFVLSYLIVRHSSIGKLYKNGCEQNSSISTENTNNHIKRLVVYSK